MSNSLRNITICLLIWLTLMVSNCTVFQIDAYAQVMRSFENMTGGTSGSTGGNMTGGTSGSLGSTGGNMTGGTSGSLGGNMTGTTPGENMTGSTSEPPLGEGLFFIIILFSFVIAAGVLIGKRRLKNDHAERIASKVSPPIESQSQPRKDKQSRVFISYAREDSNSALRLYEDLKTRTNFQPWLDKEDLLPGQNWDLEIRKAVKNSRYFVALFSSTSVSKRGYVQREFRKAIDTLDEFPEGEIFAIPVRLYDCEIPYEKLRNIQYVDLFPDWYEGLRRLLRTFDVRR
jgi:hypothetical protein